MLAYGISSTSASAYEYDHLVPLELGGSSAIANLWPERDIGGSGGFIRNAKDRVENALRSAVCSGSIPLQRAQRAIAHDWLQAGVLVGISVSASVTVTASLAAGSQQTAATPTSAASATSTKRPAGATARCNDNTYSYSAHHAGSCSGHGGVSEFFR